ncbi:MAG: KR domain-containing protein, partial [Caldilineaceae bacterium]|nr:KR domain-containing protein [Caldilineaceae bacterium]
DVTVESEVEQLLAACPKPLHGIIHMAGVLDDGVLSRQTTARFEKVMAPKVNGAWYLHCLTQDTPLDFFICFSSNASLLEEGGQGNYVAANTFLDSLMQHRRAMGLPGLSINWGAWADVGMAADLIQQMPQQGLDAIPLEVGREIVTALIANELKSNNQTGQIAAMPVNWARYLSHFVTVPSLLAEFSSKQTSAANGSTLMLRRELEAVRPRERAQRILAYLQEELCSVLMLSQPPMPQQGFLEMGMDSLMIVEFRNRLQTALDMKLPSTLLFKYPSLEELTEHLSSLFSTNEGTEERAVTGQHGTLTSEEENQAEKPLPDAESLSAEDVDALMAEKFQALTKFLEN